MSGALRSLDQPGAGTDVHIRARWPVTAADALDLAAWWVDTIGVEPVEDQPLEDWLATKLEHLLDVDIDDAEQLALDAAEALARHLGLHVAGTAYPDEGMAADPPDLLHEAIEHTGGHPGELFREIAARLRG